MPITHIIKQGESIASIAYEYGLFPDTIWSHPNNQPLKDKRKDPNILLAGDEVFIPNKGGREISKPTGALHRFRRKGVPSTLRIRFLDYQGKPRKDLPYTLEADGVKSSGTTNANGFVIQSVVPNAKQGKLLLGQENNQEEYTLQLGHLDPITEISGIQMRLNNLGFSCGDEKGEIGEKTRKALKVFQKLCGLQETAEADEATMRALKGKYLV